MQASSLERWDIFTFLFRLNHTSYGSSLGEINRFGLRVWYWNDWNPRLLLIMLELIGLVVNVSLSICTSTTAESRAKIWYQ